ncbi:EamA-like transporter family protein [Shimia haliotis]|uniref:EamA-like transporter family protein n=2 Tax=Shimia haliotis TaxID=1280847 RepID=A0A1I4G329_9RHOB|nr:DMT family transporter [Shimia haliotis]SFL23637.1 EamA-like transporter family protein [Shimia haliotis]
MVSHIATDTRANLLGSLWMVASMALFAVEDALIKAAAQGVPMSQILVIFGGGGALLFAALAKAQGLALFPTEARAPAVRLRVLFEVFGRLFYFLALALTPLSSATVILQATPLVVVGTAAVVFGESVGWRRWLAIGIGLAGVVVIIRPGGESFSALSLLAVAGMLGFAGRDLASRAAPAGLSTILLGLYGFLTVIAAGGMYAVYEQRAFVWPEGPSGLALISAIGVGVFAYTALMKAMRIGEVSAVTPFRYSRLLFGVALGVFAFGETIDGATWVGCGLIVLSGLFILMRGRAAQRA